MFGLAISDWHSFARQADGTRSAPVTAAAIVDSSANAASTEVHATTATQPQSSEAAVDWRAQARSATAGTRGPVLLCLAAVLGLAFLLRTQHISDLTMHFEECCAWKMSQFPWDEMLDAVSRDAHPPLYYILMHSVGIIGAESPVVLRGISVLFGLATILAAFWFVRTALQTESSSDRDLAAVLAAALIALNSLHVEMSLLARPYALGTFLTLLSATFVLRAVRETGTIGDWILFAVTATLLSLTNYFALFTVGAELLFAGGSLAGTAWRSGWSSGTKRTVLGLGLSVFVMQIPWSFWLPAFLFQLKRTRTQLWMGPLDWQTVCSRCGILVASESWSETLSRWEWSGVAVWGTTVLALFLFGRQAGRLAALGAGFPLAGIFAYSLAVRNIVDEPRYLIFAQTLLLVGWALLVARIPWRPVRLALSAGLLAWGGYGCWLHSAYRDMVASYPGASGATMYLNDHRSADEPVIVGSPYISPIVHKYATHKRGIFVKFEGNHRFDLCAGGAIREEEYHDLKAHWGPAVERVWTIDVFENDGNSLGQETQLPEEWVRVGQKVFRHIYHFPSILAVREYRRKPKS